MAGASSGALASKLLAHFGSVYGLLTASDDELRRVAGKDDSWLIALQAGRSLLDLGLSEQVERSPLDPRNPALREYLYARLRPQRQELVIGLFGDADGGFLAEEVLAQGQEDQVNLSARHVFARMLALDARSLVLAHNHPSGSARPSREDILTTKQIRQQGEALGITLLDHFIIGENAITSMSERGVL